MKRTELAKALLEEIVGTRAAKPRRGYLFTLAM
jgi:hypothetical protein